MEQYLINSKQIQEELSSTSKVHVVLGNESCDLDSAVSAIVYGYYLSKKFKDGAVIPVLNIPESQYRSHTEVTHLLKKRNIPAESLTFRDQVKFESLHSEGKLNIHLVDHNVLTGSDAAYQDCVTTVIDHHKRECPEKEGVTVKLDFVGSCATLVAEELLDDSDFHIDDDVAELLFGTILVDTINRSAEAGKITPRDQNVLDQLEAVLPNVKGDNLYQELQTAKFDISELLNMDLLEKDLKMVLGSGMKIAMSSVTMEMEDLLKRPDFQKDLTDFTAKKGADVVVIMTLTMDANDVPSRQIAVYSQNRIYKTQIADLLDNATEDNLELEPCFPPFDTISVFKQGNVRASRKKVMPILKSFLQGDITPDVTSKEFATQLSVSMATEGFSSFNSLLESGQNWEGTKSATEKVNDTNSSLLDIDNHDSFTFGTDSKTNVDANVTSSELVKNRLADIPEDVSVNGESLNAGVGLDIFATPNEDSNTGTSVMQFNSENVTRLENPLTDLSSTNLSSVNSSNIFDFINSDSELVDPFSSVEESITSLPNWTNTSSADTLDNIENGSKETESHVNQALLDIQSDSQSTSPAQNTFGNQSIFDITNDDHSEPLVDNKSVLDIADNQTLLNIADNQSVYPNGNQSLLDFTDNSVPHAQTSDTLLTSTNPFSDVSTDISQPTLNNPDECFTNIGGGGINDTSANNSNMFDDLLMSNGNPFGAETSLRDTHAAYNASIPDLFSSEEKISIMNDDTVDTGFVEGSNSFEIDQNNPFGFDDIDQVKSEEPKSEIDADLVDTGFQKTQDLFDSDTSNVFGTNTNNPFGIDSDDPVNSESTISDMHTGLERTSLPEKQHPFENDNQFGIDSNNPFGTESNQWLANGTSSDPNIDLVDSALNENPFGNDYKNPTANYENNSFVGSKPNPFDLSSEVKVAVESQFEDMPTEENTFQMDLLDIASTEVNGATRAKARKSISLIVEMDEHSMERMEEFNESDFYEKIPTPDATHSGETSPFVKSELSSPFEGMLTPSTGVLSVRGSGYPSISTPPNSVVEGNGFEMRDHDLPSFNSAEMVERIHRKKASLGKISDFQGIDIDGKNSVPFTPRNSFRDDLPLPSVNLILPEMENSKMEHTIREKRNSLIAAQDFTSAEDYLIGLSSGKDQTESTHNQEYETELKSATETTSVLDQSAVQNINQLENVIASLDDTSSNKSDLLVCPTDLSDPFDIVMDQVNSTTSVIPDLLAGSANLSDPFDTTMDPVNSATSDGSDLLTGPTNQSDPFDTTMDPVNSATSDGSDLLTGPTNQSDLFDTTMDPVNSATSDRSDLLTGPTNQSDLFDTTMDPVNSATGGGSDLLTGPTNQSDLFDTTMDPVNSDTSDRSDLLTGPTNQSDLFDTTMDPVNSATSDRSDLLAGPTNQSDLFDTTMDPVNSATSDRSDLLTGPTNQSDLFDTTMDPVNSATSDGSDLLTGPTNQSDLFDTTMDPVNSATSDRSDLLTGPTNQSDLFDTTMDPVNSDTSDGSDLLTGPTNQSDLFDTTMDPVNSDTSDGSDLLTGPTNQSDLFDTTMDPVNSATSDRSDLLTGPTNQSDLFDTTMDPVNSATSDRSDLLTGPTNQSDLFDTTMDPVNSDTSDRSDVLADMVPFTPSNSYIDSSGVSFMEGRHSLPDSELFDRLSDLKRERRDTDSFAKFDSITSDHSDTGGNKPLSKEKDTSDFDSFLIDQEKPVEPQTGFEYVGSNSGQSDTNTFDQFLMDQSNTIERQAGLDDSFEHKSAQGDITDIDKSFIDQGSTFEKKEREELQTVLVPHDAIEDDILEKHHGFSECDQKEALLENVGDNADAFGTFEKINKIVDTETKSDLFGINFEDASVDSFYKNPDRMGQNQNSEELSTFLGKPTKDEAIAKPVLIDDNTKDEVGFETQFEAKMLQTAEIDVAEHVSTAVTSELMNHAVDIFPDMSNSAVAECVTKEILQKTNDWTDQGSRDSGIGSSESPQQGPYNAPKSPRSPRLGHVTQYSLETDYLPNMDPLHGNLNIVTSPSSLQSVETDADKEVVEGESFRRVSFDSEPNPQPEGSDNNGVQELADISENSVTDMILTENLEKSHDFAPKVDTDYSKQVDDIAYEATHMSKEETNEFESQGNAKPEPEIVIEPGVADNVESQDKAFFQRKIDSNEELAQGDIDDLNILKDSESMMDEEESVSSPDVCVNIIKDSESMIDEEEIVSSPEASVDINNEVINQTSEEISVACEGNINADVINSKETEHLNSEPIIPLNELRDNTDGDSDQIDQDSNKDSKNQVEDVFGFNETVLLQQAPITPPNELLLDTANAMSGNVVVHKPIEINIEGCSISPDSSNSYNSSTDSDVDLVTVRENIIDSSPTDLKEQLDETITETYSLDQVDGNGGSIEHHDHTFELKDTNTSSHDVETKTTSNMEELSHSLNQLPDLIRDNTVENKNLSDNNILNSSQSESILAESTLTIETMSPAETPDHEHVSGFYEVNPDDKDIKDENQDLEKSIVDTNLGENVTGFYEINPESIDDQMVQSALTVETVSPVDTPDEEHKTGFYEVNPEINKMVVSDFSIKGVTPLEANEENTEGFDEEYPEVVDEPYGHSDVTDESTTSLETSNIGPTRGINELNSEKDHIENPPEINVLMTESTETENSDMDSNIGFYEMNSEIQGTVLQNIEIGDSFSPAESPNDDIIGISYQINPMIPDLPNESSNETDDNDKSDVSVFESYTETKNSSDEETHTTDAVLFNMADGLVNEAIKGAYEEVHVLQGREETEIVKELADAMLEDDKSSVESSEDSDVSSTTTEGSYNINCSPVMTPESESMMEEHVKRMKNKEVYVIEESLNEENEDEVEVEDVMTKDESETSLFKELDRIDEGNLEIEEDNVLTAVERDIPKFSEDYDGNHDKTGSKLSQNQDDHNEEKHIEIQGHEEMEYDVGKNRTDIDLILQDKHKEKNLVRQETVIPDIVIIPDDTDTSNDSDSDIVGEGREGTDTEPHSELEKSSQDNIVNTQDEVNSISMFDDSVKVTDDVEKTIISENESVTKTTEHTKQDLDKETQDTIKHDLDDKAEYPELDTSKEKTTVSGEAEISNNTGARSKDSGSTSKIVENPTGARSKHSRSPMAHKSDKKSLKEDSSVSITKSKFAEQEYLTRKEIFYTTAGNMSVSIDSVVDPPGLADNKNPIRSQNPISDETMQLQIAYLLAQIKDTTGQADKILSDLRRSDVTSIDDIHGYLVERFDLDLDTISLSTQPDDDFDPLDLKDDPKTTETTDSQKQQQKQRSTQEGTRQQQKSVKQQKHVSPLKNNKKRHEGSMKEMEDTQEWHEDPIPGMGVQEESSSESESESDSDSEYGKPVRPDSLLSGKKRKKKISANSNMVINDSGDDVLTPDDLGTPDDMEGELEWEDDTPITPLSEKKFEDYIHSRDDIDDDDHKDYEQNSRMKKVEIAGKDYKVDMHVIEPYKKVLSHGGYYGDGLNAIILFCGCYLPDRSRRDYQYVMDNLFLYVISTLELLVAEDYMIVYFHGATPRRQMPSFGWLKRCYQMIDRRLRKNLKALLMVHPTLWLKTVVVMTKPFISSKFSSKLRFVKTLQELGKIVPMEYIYVPDPVQQYDTKLKQQRNSSSSTSPATPISPT